METKTTNLIIVGCVCVPERFVKKVMLPDISQYQDYLG
jgi:hypothetical protein